MIKVINGDDEIRFEIVKVFSDDTIQAIISYDIENFGFGVSNREMLALDFFQIGQGLIKVLTGQNKDYNYVGYDINDDTVMYRFSIVKENDYYIISLLFILASNDELNVNMTLGYDDFLEYFENYRKDLQILNNLLKKVKNKDL